MENNYKKFLSPDEKVEAVLGYAPAEFILNAVGAGIVVLIVVGFLTLIDAGAWSITVGLVLGVLLLLPSIYHYYSVKYLVTDKRVVVKTGLIGQSIVSADYSKITDVTVNQGILGRLILRTGTIVLNTAGTDTGEVALKWVNDPFEAKNLIYKHLGK